MRRRFIGLGLMAIMLCISLGLIVKFNPRELPRTQLIGFTNYVGELKMNWGFREVTNNTAEQILEWQSKGSNIALINITNGGNRTINIWPIVRLVTKSQPPRDEQMALWTETDFSLPFLHPGSSAQVQMPVLCDDPWKVIFIYRSHDTTVDSLMDAAKRWLFKTPLQTEHYLETDWIQPKQ